MHHKNNEKTALDRSLNEWFRTAEETISEIFRKRAFRRGGSQRM